MIWLSEISIWMLWEHADPLWWFEWPCWQYLHWLPRSTGRLWAWQIRTSPPPTPDTEGERILEYALARILLLSNTCFKKWDKHSITYKSRNAATQIDYILFRKRMRKLVPDVKVVPREEVALQHQLVVCDMQMARPPKTKQKFFPRLKVWRLKQGSYRQVWVKFKDF